MSLAAQGTVSPAWAQPPAAGTAGGTRPTMTATAADLAMMEQEHAFRVTVGEFLEAAAAGDTARAQSLLSPRRRARSGAAAVARFLGAEVFLLFADFPVPGGSRTIARTTDAFGSGGFAFYLYASPHGGGERRPFVMYVVKAAGRSSPTSSSTASWRVDTDSARAHGTAHDDAHLPRRRSPVCAPVLA